MKRELENELIEAALYFSKMRDTTISTMVSTLPYPLQGRRAFERLAEAAKAAADDRVLENYKAYARKTRPHKNPPSAPKEDLSERSWWNGNDTDAF